MAEKTKIEEKIAKLIRDGEEILDREEKNGRYGGWAPGCLSTDQIKAIYKSWRKEFDEVVEELKVHGIVITPELSAETEQKILFFVKEQGYYRIKEYWQQHIEELKKALKELSK